LNKLKLLRRFVDNGIVLWVIDHNTPQCAITEPDFKAFKKELNQASTLNWTFSNLETKINFLEVNIELALNNNSINFEFSPYSKELNLHLYILSNSAHPPGVLKDMINGMLHWLLDVLI